MPIVRVGTFNVENLFARFKFNEGIDPEQVVKDGWKAEEQFFEIDEEESKRLTAQVILNLNADILGLQEVENLDTLKRFRDSYLGGRTAYPYTVVLDGNDRRLIDVALLSRYPITHIRSYQDLWVPEWNAPLFSRDCLETDVLIDGVGSLTLFVNHFKSMAPPSGSDPCQGRHLTQFIRSKQSKTVRDIVKNRFEENIESSRFIILGDLNDYLETDLQGGSGITELVQWNMVENIIDRLPENERWTHFWRGRSDCGISPVYRQLDYLLLSPTLSQAVQGDPYIERRGQPGRATRYSGPRFDNVGFDRPKASDHCALAVDLKL